MFSNVCKKIFFYNIFKYELLPPVKMRFSLVYLIIFFFLKIITLIKLFFLRHLHSTSRTLHTLSGAVAVATLCPDRKRHRTPATFQIFPDRRYCGVRH